MQLLLIASPLIVTLAITYYKTILSSLYISVEDWAILNGLGETLSRIIQREGVH